MNEFFDPGLLKYRMTLEEPDDTPDGAGGASRIWVEVQEFWANLRAVSVHNAIGNASAEQCVTHELRYRKGPLLTLADRLRYDDRYFNIRGVRDAVGDGSYQLALIEEIKP